MNSDDIAEGIIKAVLYLGAMAAVAYISYKYWEFVWPVWIGVIVIGAVFNGVRDSISYHGIWRTLIKTIIGLFGLFSVGYGIVVGYPNYSTAGGGDEWMGYIFGGLVITGFLFKIYEAVDTLLDKRRKTLASNGSKRIDPGRTRDLD